MYRLQPKFALNGIIYWGNYNYILDNITNKQLNNSGITYLSPGNYDTIITNPKNWMQLRLQNFSLTGVTKTMRVIIDNSEGESSIYYYILDVNGNNLTNIYYKPGFDSLVRAGAKYVLTLTYINDFWIAESTSTTDNSNYINTLAFNSSNICYLGFENYTAKIDNLPANAQLRLPNAIEGTTKTIKVYIDNTNGESNISYSLFDINGSSPTNLVKIGNFTTTIKVGQKYLLTLQYVNNVWFVQSDVSGEIIYKTVCLTADEYEALTSYDSNTIYHIIEG